ncbi:MAG: flagellar biosynthesis anti-sigma factor FlgM [Acidobacteriaceae bacterium]
MKIDETLSGSNGVNAVNRAQMSPEVNSADSGKPESGSTAPAGGADTATLSAGAKLASHMANVSDVRMDKVTGVQQALAAGTYHVDAGKVADKIILSILQKQA